jgi:hypothetical protein
VVRGRESPFNSHLPGPFDLMCESFGLQRERWFSS